MAANNRRGKSLRFIGIVLMGLTAGFTLLGGVGTSCVAFNPTGFGEKMAQLAPKQWLYILFVVVGIGLGVLGIRAVVQLVKGFERGYRPALIILTAGTVVGAVHVIVSRSLRGSSMPVDAVLYTTVLTLVIFLIFRAPPIWETIIHAGRSSATNKPAGGAAAILFGALALTIQYSMGPTHTWNNANYADAFSITMTSMGLISIALGIIIFISVPKLKNVAELSKHPRNDLQSIRQ